MGLGVRCVPLPTALLERITMKLIIAYYDTDLYAQAWYNNNVLSVGEWRYEMHAFNQGLLVSNGIHLYIWLLLERV